YCVAVNGAQTSLDPKELREWLPNYTYGAHAFGLKDFQTMLDQRANVLKWIKEYSPIELATRDDPPIALFYGGVKGSKPGENHPDPTHSPIMGMMLAEKLKEIGVEVVLSYAGNPHPQYPSAQAYLIERLKK